MDDLQLKGQVPQDSVLAHDPALDSDRNVAHGVSELAHSSEKRTQTEEDKRMASTSCLETIEPNQGHHPDPAQRGWVRSVIRLVATMWPLAGLIGMIWGIFRPTLTLSLEKESTGEDVALFHIIPGQLALFALLSIVLGLWVAHRVYSRTPADKHVWSLWIVGCVSLGIGILLGLSSNISAWLWALYAPHSHGVHQFASPIQVSVEGSLFLAPCVAVLYYWILLCSAYFSGYPNSSD